MAQTPANRLQDCDQLDYTPSSAVTAGDVVVLGDLVAVAERDIAANEMGSLALNGTFTVPKITGAITVGAKIYWDPAGNPVSGTAGSGAATVTAGTLKLMGYAALAAASGASTVRTVLSRS